MIRGVERENIFVFAFKSMKSQGTLGNHLKCSVTVKSHLFFCSGRSWRPRFVNSNKYSVYKEESLQGKKSIKEKQCSKQGLWFIFPWLVKEKLDEMEILFTLK